jgi:hypothetical protein
MVASRQNALAVQLRCTPSNFAKTHVLPVLRSSGHLSSAMCCTDFVAASTSTALAPLVPKSKPRPSCILLIGAVNATSEDDEPLASAKRHKSACCFVQGPCKQTEALSVVQPADSVLKRAFCAKAINNGKILRIRRFFQGSVDCT